MTQGDKVRECPNGHTGFATAPTSTSLGVLAIIVASRTFPSFTRPGGPPRRYSQNTYVTSCVESAANTYGSCGISR